MTNEKREECRKALEASRQRLNARGLDGDAIIENAGKNLVYWRESSVAQAEVAPSELAQRMLANFTAAANRAVQSHRTSKR